MPNSFQNEQAIITESYSIEETDFSFFALRGNSKDYDITLPAIDDVGDGHLIIIQHQNAGDFTQRIITASKNRKGATVTDAIDNNNSPMTVTHTGETIKLRADADAKKWWPEFIYWAGNVG